MYIVSRRVTTSTRILTSTKREVKGKEAAAVVVATVAKREATKRVVIITRETILAEAVQLVVKWSIPIHGI